MEGKKKGKKAARPQTWASLLTSCRVHTFSRLCDSPPCIHTQCLLLVCLWKNKTVFIYLNRKSLRRDCEVHVFVTRLTFLRFLFIFSTRCTIETLVRIWVDVMFVVTIITAANSVLFRLTRRFLAFISRGCGQVKENWVDNLWPGGIGTGD